MNVSTTAILQIIHIKVPDVVGRVHQTKNLSGQSNELCFVTSFNETI